MDRNTFLGRQRPRRSGSPDRALDRRWRRCCPRSASRRDNILYRINELLRRIYDLGFGAIEFVLGYLILGAMVVVPVWFISRLIKTTRRTDVPPPPRGGMTV